MKYLKIKIGVLQTGFYKTRHNLKKVEDFLQSRFPKGVNIKIEELDKENINGIIFETVNIK